MDLIIDLARSLSICIESFRGKNQIVCKCRVTIEGPDAEKDITTMEGERFISNDNLFTFEWRARGGQVVNDAIELICRLI
jgi:hypothetical protein